MASMEHAASHHAQKFTAKQKKIALFIVAFAFVMDLLDSTIVNVAIPSIQANLGASYATIQWLIAGYALTFALLLITGGRMGDVFGYKKIFLVGVAGFTVASLLTGIAPNPGFLVAARLIQGSMAALMVPQVMSLMQVMYRPEERSSIMGLFGMLGGLAASLGPIIGGLLIKGNFFNLDWRPIFLINLPVGIFAIIAGIKYLPEGKSEHPLHIDLVGTALIIVALSLLVFPLIEGRDLDWPIWSLTMLGLSIPALFLFGWYENRKHKRDKSALVVPSLFGKRSFVSGLVLNVILESVMIGYFLTATLVMQIGLGYSPIKAALTGIPTAVGMSFSFIVLGNKLIKRYGRNVISIGCAVFSAGLIYTVWVVTRYELGTHPWQFIPGLFVTGMGLALIMAPIFSAALQDVDPSHAGSASGVLSAVQQVGGAIGIAVIGVIFFGQINHGAYKSFDVIEPRLRQELSVVGVPEYVQNGVIAATRECYHDRVSAKDSTVTPESCKEFAAANQSDNPAVQTVGRVLASGVQDANAHNFATAFRWGIVYVLILLVIACGLSFTLPRKFRVIEEGSA
jgi:EmrB/QacA subfamily drug resistance transporter